jgi:hypothetical protein
MPVSSHVQAHDGGLTATGTRDAASVPQALVPMGNRRPPPGALTTGRLDDGTPDPDHRAACRLTESPLDGNWERSGEGRPSMALEMRRVCERCGAALAPADEAYICTFECTFCPTCTHAMAAVCPNCGGELVRRPRPAPGRVEE